MQGSTNDLRKQAGDIALELAERESSAQAALAAEQQAHAATKADLAKALSDGQAHANARKNAESALKNASDAQAKALDDLKTQQAAALQRLQEQAQTADRKRQEQLKAVNERAAAAEAKLQAATTELAAIRGSSAWKTARAKTLQAAVAQGQAAQVELSKLATDE